MSMLSASPVCWGGGFPLWAGEKRAACTAKRSAGSAGAIDCGMLPRLPRPASRRCRLQCSPASNLVQHLIGRCSLTTHLAGAQALRVAQPHLCAAADGAHLRGRGADTSIQVGRRPGESTRPAGGLLGCAACRSSALWQPKPRINHVASASCAFKHHCPVVTVLFAQHGGTPCPSPHSGRGRRSRAPRAGSPCCTTRGASAPRPGPAGRGPLAGATQHGTLSTCARNVVVLGTVTCSSGVTLRPRQQPGQASPPAPPPGWRGRPAPRPGRP